MGLFRREWVGRFAVAASVTVVLLTLVVAAAVTSAVSPLQHTARPNLILIVSDDQRADTLWAMPSVRGLAQHGVRFSNAFVTTSYCCPSRASILTGQYARHTGVLDDSPPDGGATAFHDSSTLATWLHHAGYTTAMIGKYLNRYGRYEPTYIPPGWDEWDAIASEPTASRYFDYTLNENGRLVHYGLEQSDYSTTVLTQIALRFLRSAKAPFFLYFAPIAPHKPATPPPGESIRTTGLRPGPAFDEPDVNDKPWAGRYRSLSPTTMATIDRFRMDYVATLASVDRAVADITSMVDDRGGLANTVIAYTSDNGLMLGEHRLQGKIWPYEESIRVPMVFRVPWRAPPRVDADLALNIDLAPTLADLAGVRPGLPEDGRSLVPLLHGRAPLRAWRSAFVVEWLGDERDRGIPPRYDAMRTRRWIYVRYENGWRELYDLRLDPHELTNLAGDPRYARTEARLAAKLRRMISS